MVYFQVLLLNTFSEPLLYLSFINGFIIRLQNTTEKLFGLKQVEI